MTKATLDAIQLKETTLEQAIAKGDLKVDGRARGVRRVHGPARHLPVLVQHRHAVIRRGRRGRIAGALLAATLAAPPAGSCGFHGQLADIAAAHPRSLDVAFALRDAYDRGELAELPALPPALGYLRARKLLVDFAAQVSAVAGDGRGSVAVLLVESGLWTRYAIDGSRASAAPHVDGPQPGEHVLLTSEAALAAIVEGRLTAERAASVGLLAEHRAR